MENNFEIVTASEADFDSIWPMFHEVVQGGDTYVYAPNITKEDAKKVWFAPNFYTYVLKEKGIVAGAYVIRPNHRDLGSHISNAAYVVDKKYRGRGYGKAMGMHSFIEAVKHGYKAMQFNYVISTNEVAIELWKNIGFQVIGIVPEAHQHQKLNRLVDIYIMHKQLV